MNPVTLNTGPAKKWKDLFNHDRRPLRQRSRSLYVPAHPIGRDVDRYPELVLKERLCGLEDVLPADRVLHQRPDQVGREAVDERGDVPGCISWFLPVAFPEDILFERKWDKRNCPVYSS